MNPRCIEKEFPAAEHPMNADMNSMNMNMNSGCGCPPIYECPDERVCERYIVHNVPHIVPIHTKMINHHIYRHTYAPCYTYQEIDTCENITDGCSGMMR